MSWSHFDLMQGMHNFIADSSIQQGETVLILTDTKVDPAISNAVATMSKQAGAKVLTMIVDPFREWSIPGGAVVEAAKAVDVLLGATTSLITRNPESSKLRHDYGLKLGMLVTTHPEILASEAATFPRSVMAVISKRMAEIASNGTRIRVVDDKGTDVSAKYKSINAVRNDIPLSKGGAIAFPLGALGPEPLTNANGVAYFNSINSLQGYYPGTWKKPVKCKIESNKCALMEGNVGAKFIEKSMHKVKGGDETIEIMWGFNPKFPVWNYMNETNKVQIERHAGVVHIGFANGYDTNGLHIDCEILNASVYIDDKPIIEEGRLKLLDDAEIRAQAEKFGDPEAVLAEIW